MKYLFALTGVGVNCLTVIIGTTIGLLFKKGINEKIKNAIFSAVALCVLYIGVSGTLKTIIENGQAFSANTLVLIFSLALGAAVGTLLDLEGRLNRLGERLQSRFAKNDSSSVAQGFVSSTLLFCIGAMAITGPIESALFNDHSTLFAKSVLDGISSAIFAISFGWGVYLSIIPLTVYQGGIAIIACLLGNAFLTPDMTVNLICAGSLIIIALALNMLNITKIKTANLLPAIFFAPVLTLLFNLL